MEQRYWFEFESKMASATNVIFVDDCGMEVAFLILLTHVFSAILLLLPIPASFLFYSDCVDFLSGLCPHLCRQCIFNQNLVYWIFRVK